MTETDVTTQLGDVLARLEGRLDSMEKGMPPAMKEAIEAKKDKAKDDDKKDDEKKSEEVEKSEYSDVITSEYLDWMESTLKSSGVDIDGARNHFDDLNKANLGSTPEEFDLDYGQTKNREQENGKPSTNAVARTTGSGGKKEVKKSDFLSPTGVTESDIEAAYEVYKAASLEQEFRGSLEDTFATRYASERAAEIAKAEAAAYDARGPLHEINKAIATLAERIETIATPNTDGTTIAKSAPVPQMEIPSTVDMHKMSWDEVHQMADTAFRGE